MTPITPYLRAIFSPHAGSAPTVRADDHEIVGDEWVAVEEVLDGFCAPVFGTTRSLTGP